MDYTAFQKRFGIILNEQQARAVQQTEGAVLLLAVPGSGKTTVLVTRLGYMLYAKGIPAEQILTMTYTVAACADMRARFAARFGSEYASVLAFRTINGLCDSVIREYIRQKGSTGFDLLENNAPLLTELYTRVVGEYPAEAEVRSLQQHITYIKNMCLTEEELKKYRPDNMDMQTLYNAYCAELQSRRRMDYDDQLVYALRILQQQPSVLAVFRNRYRYFCVDEAQDTSKIQHRIISLLAQASNNLFMVGDEDQSIYGFRAAYPEALLRFRETYRNAEVFLLEENFRSTGVIVTAAARFIARNAQRYEKNMHTARPEGMPLRKITLPTRSAQYSYITKLAAEKNAGATAVLYRNNDSAVPLIDTLSRAGVGFSVRQSENLFFTSRVVRDVTSFLRLALYPCEAESFMQIYYKCGSYAGKAAAQEAVSSCRRKKYSSLLQALAYAPSMAEHCRERCLELHRELLQMATDTPVEALARIRLQMGYDGYIRSSGGDRDKLFVLSALASRESTIPAFLARLQTLQTIVNGGGDAAQGLKLSTIHAAKGLEYDRVVLVDVLDGILPAVGAPEQHISDEDLMRLLEEERRLFYVGATRAREELLLFTYADSSGRSTFVNQFCAAPPIKKAQASAIPAAAVQRASISHRAATPAGSRVSAAHLPARTVPVADNPFPPGSVLQHKKFGTCTVLSYENGVLCVRLTGGNVIKFHLATCLEKGLLQE